MPMLVVKNSENLMHHDASLVVWYEPKKPVAEMNTAIAYERLGELIHYRIDRIEESRIYEDVTKLLLQLLDSEQSIRNRIGVVFGLPDIIDCECSQLFETVQKAVEQVLEQAELWIDLILPEGFIVCGDENKLCLFRNYIAHNYIGSTKGIVNQVLVRVLGRFSAGLTFRNTGFAASGHEYEKLSQIIPEGTSAQLRHFIEAEQTESFYQILKKEIDSRNITEVECYKRANISRKLYSKIKTQPFYKPSKQTVAAFAIALRMPMKDADRLLASVGYSLSGSSLFDIIIKFHISEGIFDIYEINNVLYDFDQCLLGG